jgi:hypothetical protein
MTHSGKVRNGGMIDETMGVDAWENSALPFFVNPPGGLFRSLRYRGRSYFKYLDGLLGR